MHHITIWLNWLPTIVLSWWYEYNMYIWMWSILLDYPNALNRQENGRSIKNVWEIHLTYPCTCIFCHLFSIHSSLIVKLSCRLCTYNVLHIIDLTLFQVFSCSIVPSHLIFFSLIHNTWKLYYESEVIETKRRKERAQCHVSHEKSPIFSKLQDKTIWTKTNSISFQVFLL